MASSFCLWDGNKSIFGLMETQQEKYMLKIELVFSTCSILMVNTWLMSKFSWQHLCRVVPPSPNSKGCQTWYLVGNSLHSEAAYQLPLLPASGGREVPSGQEKDIPGGTPGCVVAVLTISQLGVYRKLHLGVCQLSDLCAKLT